MWKCAGVGFALPKKTTRVCRDEVHAVLMGPVVDLQLLLQRDTTKDNGLLNDMCLMKLVYRSYHEEHVPGNP